VYTPPTYPWRPERHPTPPSRNTPPPSRSSFSSTRSEGLPSWPRTNLLGSHEVRQPLRKKEFRIVNYDFKASGSNGGVDRRERHIRNQRVSPFPVEKKVGSVADWYFFLLQSSTYPYTVIDHRQHSPSPPMELEDGAARASSPAREKARGRGRRRKDDSSPLHWFCPNCHRRYAGARGLKEHIHSRRECLLKTLEDSDVPLERAQQCTHTSWPINGRNARPTHAPGHFWETVRLGAVYDGPLPIPNQRGSRM
jgi:hypothetical protein